MVDVNSLIPIELLFVCCEAIIFLFLLGLLIFVFFLSLSNSFFLFLYFFRHAILFSSVSFVFFYSLHFLFLFLMLFSLPMSNGHLERIFSQLKLIKTNRRNGLGEGRLDSLLRIVNFFLLNLSSSSFYLCNPFFFLCFFILFFSFSFLKF